MDLLDKKLGKGGDFQLDLKEGKIVLSVGFKEGPTDAALHAAVDVEYFMDKLAALIPGKVDDAVIALLKGALKGL